MNLKEIKDQIDLAFAAGIDGSLIPGTIGHGIVLEQADRIKSFAAKLFVTNETHEALIAEARRCLLLHHLKETIPTSEFLKACRTNVREIDELLRVNATTNTKNISVWLFLSIIRLISQFEMVQIAALQGRPIDENAYFNALETVIQLHSELAKNDAKLTDEEKQRYWSMNLRSESHIFLFAIPRMSNFDKKSAIKQAKRLIEDFEQLIKCGYGDKILDGQQIAQLFMKLADLNQNGEYAASACQRAYLVFQEAKGQESPFYTNTAQTLVLSLGLLMRFTKENSSAIRSDIHRLVSEVIGENIHLPYYLRLNLFLLYTKYLFSERNGEEIVSRAFFYTNIPKYNLFGHFSKEDVISYSEFMSQLGGMFFYIFCKQDRAPDAIFSLDISSSIYWKFSRANLSKYRPLKLMNPENKKFLLERYEGRHALTISLSCRGLSWTVGYVDENGELKIRCYTSNNIDQSSLAKLYNGEAGIFRRYSKYSQRLNEGHTDDLDEISVDFNNALCHVLEWCWKELFLTIFPSLQECGLKEDGNLHIIRTGGLSLLPLHAAGFQGIDGNWCCASDIWTLTLGDSLDHDLYDPKPTNFDSGAKSGKWLGVTDPSQALGYSSNPAEGFHEMHDLVGVEASLENFVQELPDASVVSILSHGIFDIREPHRSKIQFSGGEDLYLDEIVNLPMGRRSTVLLNICDGANHGGTQPGESLGFATGFLWAGAERVVAPAWPTLSKAAEIMIKRVSKALASNQSLPKAINAAQKEMRNGISTSSQGIQSSEGDLLHFDYSQPIHWAAYAVYSR